MFSQFIRLPFHVLKPQVHFLLEAHHKLQESQGLQSQVLRGARTILNEGRKVAFSSTQAEEAALRT